MTEYGGLLRDSSRNWMKEYAWKMILLLRNMGSVARDGVILAREI